MNESHCCAGCKQNGNCEESCWGVDDPYGNELVNGWPWTEWQEWLQAEDPGTYNDRAFFVNVADAEQFKDEFLHKIDKKEGWNYGSRRNQGSSSWM